MDTIPDGAVFPVRTIRTRAGNRGTTLFLTEILKTVFSCAIVGYHDTRLSTCMDNGAEGTGRNCGRYRTEYPYCVMMSWIERRCRKYP
jgi:hypothetical protein